MHNAESSDRLDVAIVGMTCRFPGAKNVQQFWENLKNGVESISFFSAEDARRSHVDPAALENPNYVNAGTVIEEVDLFDASFFGFSSKEAEITDPQHRIFLECAYEVLEGAGYDPETYNGLIGVYAGVGANTYLLNHLATFRGLGETTSGLQILIGNDKDYLATRTSYKLNLRGPSIVVQTACSTSLVAVHLACESLLNGECDIALAGGVSIRFPQERGYYYQEGAIYSPDGHCRAFDARARGTVFGNGIGIVALKRLSDAIADGDQIHAIIKSSATNNDGSLKIGYTAPGVSGQQDVIANALAMAGVDAETITYIEAHGTGTPLGDPVEISALNQVFRACTDKKGFCAIGSVKTNIGHLDTAAGIAGLIKTVLALKHKMLPPSLHFDRPNPKIDFESSPFYVNAKLSKWEPENSPRRAGVSSFGIGGSNAHVVVEEAPAEQPSGESRPWQLLLLSARTAAALENVTNNLADYLKQNRDVNLADVAHTLQVGRRGHAHRRMLVCSGLDDALSLFDSRDPSRVHTNHREPGERPVVFMFPGQGAQYPNMGLELYETEDLFRDQVDACVDKLKTYLGFDLSGLLFPRGDEIEAARRKLNETFITQPTLFVIEYSLARLWQHWGLSPEAMIGHSIGEYVAACLAGVLSLDDALMLVALRGKLMQQMAPGASLAVPVPAAQLGPLLSKELSVAATNTPSSCTISGPTAAIEELQGRLSQQGIESRRLHTSHAFHSSMMGPILEPFTEQVRKVRLSPPRIPYLSNVTGRWITAEEAMDPLYWAKHLRQTVRFSEGLQELLKEPERVFLEVGPGNSLSTMAMRHLPSKASGKVLSSMRHPNDSRSDMAVLLSSLGQLWIAGANIDWLSFYARERRRRLPLPTYPFERRRYWITPPEHVDTSNSHQEARSKPSALAPSGSNVASWFYAPAWRLSAAAGDSDQAAPNHVTSRWLVFTGDSIITSAIARQLESRGVDVITVRAGESFERVGPQAYTINPRRRDDYGALIEEIRSINKVPGTILHLWTLSSGGETFAEAQEAGFYSLVFLAQALETHEINSRLRIVVVSNQTQQVKREDILVPEKSTVLAPCKVIPQEYPHIACFSVDVVIPEPGPALEELERELAAEMFAQSQDPVVAFREGKRYAQDFEAVRMPEQDQIKSRLRENGVYLITGGLGRVGFSLAKYLARAVKAKLVLTGRTELPSPEHWDEWLAGHQEGDKISEKIIKVRELEAEGAQVLALCADASSFEQMQRALACAQGRFGSINGVIHASGVVDAGAFRLIKDARLAEYEINVSAKVHGLFILEKALQESRLDFCLLASSLSSILGGLAHVEYSAANLFMDAFARKHNQTSPTAWTSVNWDRWEQENDRRSAISNPSNHLLKAGITPGEGAEVFRCLLSFDRASQIIVSPANLHDRINRWIKSGLSNGEADARDRAFMPAGDKLERAIAAIWQRTLGAEVGFNDNFFDLGGDSLTGIQIISEIKRELGAHVNPATLYEAPTVSALARYIRPGTPIARTPGARQSATRRSSEQKELAIVGMAGRFPGAKNVDQFWNNLLSGVESITFFTDEELLSSGVDPAVLKAPNYVKAKPVLEDVDLFDCAFFGYNPREAEVLDPQIRLFLECAWEALENAGYDSEKYAGSIGVFAGASLSTYLLNLLANPGLVNQVGSFQTLIGNEKDSLPTIASYKLGLTGPSVAVQTFCSTSLVALHVAAQSLLAGECDMALAGGVSVNLPQREGYFSESGGLTSPDGHCRAFDEEAQGMILGSGAAVVVVKRLDDALASGDCIYAVIKGSAINNDGSLRAGYSAPGVVGQADVVSKALASAGVEADTISYIETHGSGTQLGDAVEVAALTKAFQGSAQSKRSCAIGSVKTNVGHLDRAAGVTGLIKACLSLKHKVLPPSLNFQKPSSRIDFDGSPFYVNASLSQWKANGSPRRAGVTSLGVGGTNAHVILEEPPDIEASKDKRPWQLLMVSARTTSALEVATKNLTEYLRQNADVNLADVAFTYQVGRRDFKYRRIALCRDVADAIKVFENCDPKRVFTTVEQDGDRSVAFMFSGLGDHYVNMARGLYQSEAIFREQVDRCSQLLMPHLGVDLREVIYPEKGSEKSGASDQPEKLNLRRMLRRDEAAPDENARNLNQTRILQPALFVIEYSLAKLWIEWGIKPQAMIGYSLGEYVAACLAGVMSLEDALCLVARRAQMIQELPGGAMLAVSLPEGEIAQALGNDLSLSAINGLSLCVISGPVDAIADAERELGQKGIACSRLQTSHAFHSKMMRPIAGRFAELVASVKLSPPQVPYLSNVTGEWITPEQATDPNYWVRHLCEAVRFADGIDRLKEAATTLLEIGPGQTLSSLTAQYFTSKGVAGPLALASLRSEYDEQPDAACLLRTLGKLWLAGAKIDWAGFYNNERRRRLPLPTYPFERQRYWIEPQDRSLAAFTAQQRRDRKPDIADWFYAPAWRQSVLSDSTAQINSGDQEACWLIFLDECGVGSRVANRLAEQGRDVIGVMTGQRFRELDNQLYEIGPADPADYKALFDRLKEMNKIPASIVHLWNLTPDDCSESTMPGTGPAPASSFFSLVLLAQALGAQDLTCPVELNVICNETQAVTGEERISPRKAMLLGPCRVIPQEYSNITCRSIDILLPARSSAQEMRLIDSLIKELTAGRPDPVVAYRGPRRWAPVFEPVRLERAEERSVRLAQGGVYLITGGLGGLGLAVAQHLAEVAQAKLVLISRSGLPPVDQWDQYIASCGDDDRVGTRIKKVRALETAGAEALVIKADVTSREQMLEAVALANEKYGEIQGVIHAAGLPGIGLIQLKTAEAAARTLAPKVDGALVLQSIFKDSPLDFMVLFSSTISITGGIGQVDYCAANAFLDAFAVANSLSPKTHTVSINWDAWQWTDWQDSMMALDPQLQSQFNQARERYGIKFHEGVDALSRVLNSSFAQLIVATRDLDAIIRQHRAFTASNLFEEMERARLSRSLHPRPNLGVAYVPPGNELEQSICALWQELLGIEQVGVEDNFFELGGHSLLATQLISRLKKRFYLDIPLRAIYESPTVAEMALVIEELLIDKIEGLPEEGSAPRPAA